MPKSGLRLMTSQRDVRFGRTDSSQEENMRRMVCVLTVLGTLAVTSMPAAARHQHGGGHHLRLQHHGIASGWPYYYGPPKVINDDAIYAAGPVWRGAAKLSARRLMPR
jgi:hypothetical protein